jgi:phosphoglycerate dehydrogenase-like enzyme
LKDGAIFISITGETIVDIDAMLAALDSGKLSYLAHDSGGISVGDTKDPFYQKLLKHPNVYVTPHIAFNTDVERKMCDDMMIDNVEAWVNGRPINIVM